MKSKSPALLSFIEALASRWTIAILVVIFLLLMLVIFPLAIGRLTALSGGVGLIDMEVGYSPNQVYQMIAAYGEQGRQHYILTTLTADLLYPLDYGLLLALLILVSYRRAFPTGRLVRFLVWMPLLATAFDLLENACIVTMLASYPAQLILVAQLAGMFTLVKWALVLMSVVLVLVGGIGLVVAMLQRKAQP